MKSSLALLLFVCALCYTRSVIADTWVRQQPPATNAIIHGVFFVDESTGWLVDRDENIMHTNNGGATWQFQTVPPEVDLFWYNASLQFADATHGWALSGENHIVRTTDGGSTWTVLNTGVNAVLWDMHFVDLMNGWVVGDGGTIFHSADGGLSWSAQISNVSTILYGVRFVDQSAGWVAGEAGVILKTVDGGDTWLPQASGTNSNLKTIHFQSASSGWVVGSGIALHTLDGGNSWQPRNNGLANVDCRSVSFVSENIGVIAGVAHDSPSGGAVFYTSNAGVSWSQVIHIGYELNSVAFGSQSVGYAVGALGVIVKTTNAGASWSDIGSLTAGGGWGLDFVNPTTGWYVAGYDGLIQTTDGGATWHHQSSIFGGRAIDFINTTTGWYVRNSQYGGGNGIHKTIDGGQTWTLQSSVSGLWDVSFFGSLAGLAVGENGQILRTNSSGLIWSPQTSGTSELLRDVEMNNAAWAWVVGENGTVLRTTDGGNNWNLVDIGTAGPLYEVEFVNDNTGWICGETFEWPYQPPIWHTTDAGETWTRQTNVIGASSYWFRLQDIEFVDVSTGWACQGSEILHTIDGGEHWFSEEQSLGITGEFWNLSFVDAFNGWVVGFDGVIARYQSSGVHLYVPNGGNTWYIGDEQNFGWTASDFSGGSTIELNRNYPFGPWETVVAGALNNGLYPWIVAGPTTRNARAKIFRTAQPAVSDLSNSDFSIIPRVWFNSSVNNQDYYEAVSFASSNVGWAVGYLASCGYCGGIIKTEDQGLTWSQQAGASPLYGVCAVNSSTAWAVGEYGQILGTTDGGYNWVFYYAETDQNLYDVDFVDSQDGWLVGNDGVIARTTTGSDWMLQHSQPGVPLRGVDFVNVTNGWAVGGDLVLKTEDGGSNWESHSVEAGRMLQDVAFSDLSRGWVVGNNGYISRSTDGGLTWTTQSSGTGENLQSIAARSEQSATVVGSGGIVIATEDGGLTWNPQTTEAPNNYFTGVDYSGGCLGWAVGTDGAIWKHDEMIPCISLSLPQGGETLYLGAPYTIRWGSTHVTGDVHIHLYRGAPPHGEFLQAISIGTANDGEFDWEVFPWLEESNDYYVGIAETDDEPWDYSNSAFTIAPDPAPEVSASIMLYEYEGVTYRIGVLSWQPVANVSYYDIYRSDNCEEPYLYQYGIAESPAYFDVELLEKGCFYVKAVW